MTNRRSPTDPEEVRITVQLRPDVARALHRPVPASGEAKAVAELRATLEPMHPGVEDPQLATYFTVELADVAEANRLLDRLRANPVIEAAYLKPADAPP